MNIADQLKNIKAELPDNVCLVAVSKTKSNGEILQAYDTGQRVFGENKVQELVQKHEDLPGDIQWHFIGHLQRNKVKYIAPFVTLIHAVDSMKLLKTIEKEATKNKRSIDVLLQFHIAKEESKFGLNPEKAKALLEDEQFAEMKHVRVKGVMGMATYTEDTEQIRQEFKKLKNIFSQLKTNYFDENQYFSEISMGMSGDYKLAIEEGSTMVRVGSSIFGERNYSKK